jgi:hypothetical protein
VKTEKKESHAFVDEPAKYERRVVAFYDVMGWKSKIDRAGADSARITQLKNIVRLFSTTRGEYGVGTPFQGRITTFSDNVVVSANTDVNSLFTVIVRLGMMQFGAAQIGFLIRGGITIGDILHDEHVVFGPALNQAYLLECSKADKPRIVIDPAMLDELKKFNDLIGSEDGIHYIDPWTLKFAALYLKFGDRKEGAAQDQLISIMQYLSYELKQLPDDDINIARLNWLYKKLLAELGLPATNIDEALDAMRGH